jgi:hypothetical protein
MYTGVSGLHSCLVLVFAISALSLYSQKQIMPLPPAEPTATIRIALFSRITVQEYRQLKP